MVEKHIVPLEKGVNFRDLGGFVLKNGKRIKKGLLFRSGTLHFLTQNDCTTLEKMNLMSIIDYRDACEITDAPDVIPSTANYFHFPANPISKEVTASFDRDNPAFHGDSYQFMLKLYRELPFNNHAYKKLVEFLKDDEIKPLVQHCAIGKDRTGIGSAIILFTLGADLEVVLRDYLMTEITLAPYKQRLLSLISNDFTADELENKKCVFAAKEEYLMTSINEINRKYDSVDAWLKQEYGLTDDVKKQIQSKYLEAI